MMKLLFALLSWAMAVAVAFQSSPLSQSVASASMTIKTTTTTALLAEQQQGDIFMQWAKASRSASANDNVVELLRPLGLILKQDDNQNVYVETVAPNGNAARSGKVP